MWNAKVPMVRATRKPTAVGAVLPVLMRTTVKENTVMPSQAADVLADCCTVGQVEVLNSGC